MSTGGQEGVTIRCCPEEGCHFTIISQSGGRALRRHMRGHKPPLVCSYCSATWDRSDFLRTHEWAQHGVNTAWVCYQPLCRRGGQGLLTEGALEKHLQGHGVTAQQNANMAPIEASRPLDAAGAHTAGGDQTEGEAAGKNPKVEHPSFKAHNEEATETMDQALGDLLVLEGRGMAMRTDTPDEFRRTMHVYADKITEMTQLLEKIHQKIKE